MAFGLKQINKKTPRWAIWLFRIVFLLTTIATFIIASEPESVITNELKVRIGIYLKALDMLVFGLSKMVGVEVKEESPEASESKETNKV